MGPASTNEERFLASCATVGEADVRQKLGAGRYSERRAEWAAKWLEQLESGKSDATKAEERSSRLTKTTRNKGSSLAVIAAVLVAVAVAGAVAISNLL